MNNKISAMWSLRRCRRRTFFSSSARETAL